MIHTQYYALMRALAASIQRASPNIQINQWDYNFGSKTFDSIKLHRNPQPFPKGIINITNSQKLFTFSLPQNTSVGTNAADLIQFPNVFPIASVIDKFEIYGISNRYNLTADITLKFETNAQLLDFYHNYSEWFPNEGKYFYDFEYEYYLYIPQNVIEDYDPTRDDAINLFAQMKDDASNFDLFARCTSAPLIQCTSITMNQNKEADEHSINIQFNIQDSFIYMLMKTDANYWVRALSLSIYIKVLDFKDEEQEIDHWGPQTVERTPYPDFISDANENQVGDVLVTDSSTNNDTKIKEVT